MYESSAGLKRFFSRDGDDVPEDEVDSSLKDIPHYSKNYFSDIIDTFAKRYGWSIDEVLNLTRRQVRLLLVSAGDHERLPKKDSKEQDGDIIDLTKKGSTQFKADKIPEKYLKILRKGVKEPGKWVTFGESDEKTIAVARNNPVKGKSGVKNDGEMKNFLDSVRTNRTMNIKDKRKNK